MLPRNLTRLLFDVTANWEGEDSFESLNDMLRASGNASRSDEMERLLETHQRTGIPGSLQSTIDDAPCSYFSKLKDPKVILQYIEYLIDEMITGRPVSPLHSVSVWLYYVKYAKCDDLSVGRFLRCDVIGAIKSGLVINAGNIRMKDVTTDGTRPTQKQVREILADTYAKVRLRFFFLEPRS